MSSHSDEDFQSQETNPNLPYYYPSSSSYEYQYYPHQHQQHHHQESFTCLASEVYPYNTVYNNDTTTVYSQTPIHPETTSVNVLSSTSSSQGTPDLYTQTPPLTETFISSAPSQLGTPEVQYTQTPPLTETFISLTPSHGGITQTPPFTDTFISSTNPSRGTPEVQQWIQTPPHTELTETTTTTTFIASTPSQGSGSPEVLTSPYNSDETLPISELGPSTSNSVPAINDTPITFHDVRLRSNIDGASLEKYLILLSSRPKIFRCIVPCCMSPELKGTQAAKAHVYRHLFGPSKPYVCRTCNVEFASERAAERHRRYQEKRFTCGICGRPFARKDARQAHEKKAKCGGSLLGFPEFQQ